MKLENNEIKAGLLEDITSESDQLVKQLLRRGIKVGDVDPRINLDLTARLLTNLILGGYEYIVFKNRGEMEKSKNEMELVDELFTEVMKIIRLGLKF
jgi:ketopantoate reductase